MGYSITSSFSERSAPLPAIRTAIETSHRPYVRFPTFVQIDSLSAPTNAVMIMWLLANHVNLGNRNFSSSRGTALARVLATTPQDDRSSDRNDIIHLKNLWELEYFEARLRYHHADVQIPSTLIIRISLVVSVIISIRR